MVSMSMKVVTEDRPAKGTTEDPPGLRQILHMGRPSSHNRGTGWKREGLCWCVGPALSNVVRLSIHNRRFASHSIRPSVRPSRRLAARDDHLPERGGAVEVEAGVAGLQADGRCHSAQGNE